MSNQNPQEYFDIDTNDLICPGDLISDEPTNIVMTTVPKLHTKIIGKRGGTVDKLRTKHDVKKKIPKKREVRNPDVEITVGYQLNMNDVKNLVYNIVDRRINEIMESLKIDGIKMKPVRMYCANSNQNPHLDPHRKKPHTNTDTINITREFLLSVSSIAQNNIDASSVRTEFINCIIKKSKQENGDSDINGSGSTSLADSKIKQSENGGTDEGGKVQLAESTVSQMMTISRQDENYQNDEVINDTLRKNICNEISSETGVKIEIFPANDNSTFILNGNKDDVAATKHRIAANFQIQEKIVEIVLKVPPKYHSHFLKEQAEVKMRISAENNGVSIIFPPVDSFFSDVFIKGPKYFVDQAKNKIKAIVNDLEKRNVNGYHNISQQNGVSANSTNKEPIAINMNIEPELHTMLIGIRGATAENFRTKYDVKIVIPQKGEINNAITIIGNKLNVENAKNEILNMIDQRKNCYKRKIFIESQIRSRIIGYQGSHIRQIMDEYHVYIKTDHTNPNLFILCPDYGFTRHEVERCINYLHAIQEKYICELIEYNQKSQNSFKSVIGNGDQRERTQANTHTNSTRNFPSCIGTKNTQQ